MIILLSNEAQSWIAVEFVRLKVVTFSGIAFTLSKELVATETIATRLGLA